LEAHRSYERFEEGHRVAAARDGHGDPHYGRNAALAVAVMAAFLALATFLANEAVKEVVTGETHRADTSARLESNRVKIDIASGNAGVLEALGAGSAQAQRASAEALRHEARIAHELKPADARLSAEVEADEGEADHANTQHLDYELAEVGLQVGIVLASVSIIARRRWLLACGGAVATAGVVLLAVGLVA
jgi:rRNA maturation endonuclease Nob1